MHPFPSYVRPVVSVPSGWDKLARAHMIPSKQPCKTHAGILACRGWADLQNARRQMHNVILRVSESREVGGAGWVSALSPGAASMPQVSQGCLLQTTAVGSCGQGALSQRQAKAHSGVFLASPSCQRFATTHKEGYLQSRIVAPSSVFM